MERMIIPVMEENLGFVSAFPTELGGWKPLAEYGRIFHECRADSPEAEVTQHKGDVETL